ncbi:MAG: glycerol kinase GlpK [Bythopirellula sp.]|nr:glycerol kinase GlpK [Bythopirellula sp.]
MSLILGIDQSTSATKAVLFDQNGRIIDKAVREHRQIYPQSGWVEHDAEEIWQNVLAVVAELAARHESAFTDLVGLSITNQRETFVVFDRESGRPLHNAIVWQCRRGDAICQELGAAGRGPLVQARTGLKLDTYFPASKIAWLMRELPAIAAEIQSGRALIGTIDAYLVYRLTGGKVFATDHTNASRTLLYDVHQLAWESELCALFGIPLAALPEVRDCSARFGETNVEGTLPRSVPICGVMGDSQASLFAQCCFVPGMAKATFGTGTSVLLNVGNQPQASTGGAVLALAWVLAGKPTYALEGIINYSSATITWLRDQLQLIADPAECETLAREVEDSDGVYLVPAFAGLSAPHWKSDARAAIFGMTGHTRKAHIVRAALESISYQIRDVLDMLQQESGIFPQMLLADGGPTCNEFLMQFTADMIERDLVVTNAPESSCLGAVFAGMLRLGIHDSLETLAQLPRETKTYRPQRNTVEVQRLRVGWQTAVSRLL